MAIAGYNIYKAGVKQNVSLITNLNFALTGLPTGTVIDDYTIKSVDDEGLESDAASFPSFLTKPNTVANFTASVISDSQIDLSWDATTGADSYLIERSLDNITFNVIEAAFVGNSYNDNSLDAGTQYYYRIKAENATGLSVNFATVNATTESNESEINNASILSETSDSYTIEASATNNDTIYAVSVIQGETAPTKQQIIDGQKSDGLSAPSSASGNYTGTPINLNLLSLPNNIFDTYLTTTSATEVFRIKDEAIINPDVTTIESYSPLMWLDATDYSKYTTGAEDNLGLVADSIIGRDGVFSFVPNDGTLSNKGKFAKDSLYGHAVTLLKTGVVGDFNFLHNGTPFDLTINYYLYDLPDVTGTKNIFRTTASSSGTGLNFRLYNSSSLNREYAYQVFISNGASTSLNLITSEFAATPNSWNKVRLKFDGTNLEIISNDVSVGNANGSGFSVSNHDLPIAFFNSQDFNLKNIIFFDRELTITEENEVNSFIDLSNQVKYNVFRPVNIYLSGGQSNEEGRGENANIAPELNGLIGAEITNGYGTLSGYWNELSPSLGASATMHSYKMRFGYEMFNDGNEILLYSAADSGLDLKQVVGELDWNVNSVGEIYDSFINSLLGNILPQLTKYRRRTPVIRAFTWVQGEADAQNDGSTYQTDLENLLKGIADSLTNAGYSTEKMRVTIMRMRDVFGGFDPTALSQVRAAQEYVGDNFLIDFPAYADRVKATRWVDCDTFDLALDDLHYNALGCDKMGQNNFNYYKDFVNE